MLDSTLGESAPPHFIVIVPGYMGSKLRDKQTGELVWVDFNSIPKNPLGWNNWILSMFEKMKYPSDLEPAGIVDELLFLPTWIKQEHYGRLLDALETMGYKADPEKHSQNELDVYTFSYDWRQDNRISGKQLGHAIRQWQVFHPDAEVWLIGHSNGGIVSRWYIEKEGGKEYVRKLFLMGSPWDGAPKGMQILFSGLDTLFRRRFNIFNIPKLTRDVLRTFPSSYQLVPVKNPFLRGGDNETIDPFLEKQWLPDEYQQKMLLDGRRFNEELGTSLSVETLCFFGRKLPTTSFGIVQKEAGDKWDNIEWFATEVGDGTVPERSAIHPEADQKLPFIVGHGDIYVNPAVLEFLQWELIDKHAELDYAILVTPDYQILFVADQDVYSPEETVHILAEVYGEEDRNGDRTPLDDVKIVANLNWIEALPGERKSSKPVEPISATMSAGVESGSYRAQITLPDLEGYFHLTGEVHISGQKPLLLEEIILVEGIPD